MNFLVAPEEARRFDRFWVPSACGKYRYVLRRRFHERAGRPLRLCVWMNPSTADDKKDDATIKVALSSAWAWGDGGIVVLNAMDLILTDSTKLPENLWDAVGHEHWKYVYAACAGEFGAVHKEVFCGWGDACGPFTRNVTRPHATFTGDTPSFCMYMELIRKGLTPMTIGTTKLGNPKHPLRQKLGLPLVRFG